MIYSEVRDAVRALVTVDGNRHGVSKGLATYFDRMVRLGLIDLQSYIEQLRANHRDVFTQTDLIQEGAASSGAMPDGKIRDAYYITKGNCACVQRPLIPYPWANRNDLICGQSKLFGWRYFISIDPTASEFLIFPALTAGAELWLYWDGIKKTWADGDATRFTEEEAQAVAYYVKAHIAREVDKDLLLSASYMSDYIGDPNKVGLRTRLYLDWRKRAQAPSMDPSPQQALSQSCSTIDCCWSNAGVGCGFKDGFLYLKGDDDLWHKITLEDVDDVTQFKVGAGVEIETFDTCIVAKADGYLFSGGYFHLLDESTGAYIAITAADDPGTGTPIWSFLPQKGTVPFISLTAPFYELGNPCISVLNTDSKVFCPLTLVGNQLFPCGEFPTPQLYLAMEETSGDRIDSVNALHLPMTMGFEEAEETSAAGLIGNAARLGPAVLGNNTVRGFRSDWDDGPVAGLAYGGGSFEFLFWFKFNSQGSGPPNFCIATPVKYSGQNVANPDYESDDDKFSFLVTHSTGFGIKATITNHDDDSSAETATAEIIDTDWHMVRAFYDSSTNKVGLQIDQGEVLLSDSAVTPVDATAYGVLQIMQQVTIAAEASNDFQVDEYGLYPARLTDTQVALLYNSGSARTYPFA